MIGPQTATVFDIETKIDWDFVESAEYREPLEESYSPPANYKDDIKIAAHHTDWWANIKNGWNTNPLTGRIVSIAWGDLWDEDLDDIAVVAGDDERAIIEAFAAAMRIPTILSGFAIRVFDIPFVTARASILGIELPFWWPHGRDYRYVADIRDVAATGKLDMWLHRCGLPPKTASGDQVELMSIEEVRDYNRNDVQVERLLARRFAPNMPALRETRPAEPETNYDDIPL